MEQVLDGVSKGEESSLLDRSSLREGREGEGWGLFSLALGAL